MIKNLWFLVLISASSLSHASLIVSNLDNDSITQSSRSWITGGGKLALGFTTGPQTVFLDSITMRLSGRNFAAPVNATTPVDIYSSTSNGSFDEPGTLLGSLMELSVGAPVDAPKEYTSVAMDQIILNSDASYWAVLTTGSFEDLYAYQGGDVIGEGNVVSPSLRFQYNDTEWNQLASRTFAMEVQGTVVPLPAALPLFVSAITFLFASSFVQRRRVGRERLA